MNGTFSHEIINDFTVGMTLYACYDNRPPHPGARTSAAGVSLTPGPSV